MKQKFLIVLIILLPLGLFSQKNVGIGTLTPATDAVLDLSANDKGLLVPRLTTAERNAIGPSSNGLMVYDTDMNLFYYWKSASGIWQVIDDFSKQNELVKLVTFDNVSKQFSLMDSGGIYNLDLSILSQMLSFNNDTLYLSDANQIYLGEYHKDSSSSNELQMITVSNDSIFLDRGGVIQLPEGEYWNTDGNFGTNPNLNHLGTRDNQPLAFRTNGRENMRLLPNGNFGLGTTNPTSRLQVDGGRVEFTATTDASGTAGTGVLEIGNSLRIDGNEMITNSNSTLYLQSDNNGDLAVDNNTVRVDASTNRVGVRTGTPAQALDVAGIVRLDPETNNGTVAMPVTTVDAQGDINSNGLTPTNRAGSSLDWGGFSISPGTNRVINLPNPANNYVVISQLLIYTWCNSVCVPVEINFKKYWNQQHSFAYSINNGAYTSSTANVISVPISTSCNTYNLRLSLNSATNDITCSMTSGTGGTGNGLYITNGKTTVIRAL